jgi:hypothetical protein
MSEKEEVTVRSTKAAIVLARALLLLAALACGASNTGVRIGCAGFT